MNEILLQIYFSMNLFIAGYNFNSDMKEARFSSKEIFNEKLYTGFILLSFTLFNMLFGALYSTIMIIWFFLTEVFKTINFTFQLDFWWSWFFTKKWESADKDTLARINQIAKRKKRSTLHGRIYLYGLDLINKKNNYTYTDEP